MRNLSRLVALAATAGLLAGCFPQGRHPYTASGPTDANNQAFWTDFSSARDQKDKWREQVEGERRARMANYFKKDDPAK
jgi:hypothetical protein